MARISTGTRQALYLSGLHRFAAEGWQAARVRDIVADAGQANDSAVNYHFGSRLGLLTEILTRGVMRMEEQRHEDMESWRLRPPGLEEAVRGVIAPLADLLGDAEGRCLLRVIAQVGPLTEVGRTVTAAPIEGTALQAQIEVLVAGAEATCGREWARHRVRQLVVMATAELAVRAEGVPDGHPDGSPDGLSGGPTNGCSDGLTDGRADGPRAHREYVADLVQWLAAGLDRPAPGIPG